MTTVALILAFWLAAGVAVAAVFSWLKRDDRALVRQACARNRHRSALKPNQLTCDCGAIDRSPVPWLDRDEEFWTDDEDVA